MEAMVEEMARRTENLALEKLAYEHEALAEWFRSCCPVQVQLPCPMFFEDGMML